MVLNADPEHGGLRFAVLATFLVSFFILFIILAIFLRSLSGSLVSEFYFALSCLGAIPLSIAAAGIVEYVAKQRWHSGRSLVVGGEGIVATVDPEKEQRYSWDGHMSVIKWYFRLGGYRRGGRERRIPADWLCFCCQVQQDEDRFVIFSYMPEEKAGQFIEDKRFHELRPGDFYEDSAFRRWLTPPNRPDIPTKVLAGKEGHFWLAERRRWTKGMELEIMDFVRFMEVVKQRVVE